MATTAQQLITRAYRTAGAVSSGDDPTADELADGLEALNDLLYNWSEEKVTTPWTTTDYFKLTPGTIEYSFGPALPGGGTVRPIHFADAWIIDVSSDAAGWSPLYNEGQTYPFKIIDSREYANISQKAQTGRPSRGWYSYGEPNGTLVIDRDPDQTYTLVALTTKDINTFSTLATESAMPPSYNRALRFNLAVEIGSELGAPLDPRVIKIADDSVTSLKNANSARRVRNLTTDQALLRAGRYDIASDS